MRFLFCDRIVKIDKMRTIEGVKTFNLADEYHRAHFVDEALVPGVIFIEAMAQLLGWLISYSHDFKLLGIMSMIERVEVPTDQRTGFESRIHGEILSTNSQDTLAKAWIEVGGKTVASLERIIFIHFHDIDSAEMAKLFRYCSGLKDF
jgi:3-hydroxyacyl-[acyl-carrier-protein] dehydratase